MKQILWLALCAVILMSCMSNYYNQYGGYPLDTQEHSIKEDNVNSRLLITSRYFYEETSADSSLMNISVKIIVPKEDLAHLHIDKLALKTLDESYFYAYRNPVIYDTFGRFPIQNKGHTRNAGETATNDNLCIFTVNNAVKDYQIMLTYKLKNSKGEFETFEKTLPLIITEKKTN